jgi:O-antigen ligase
MSGIYKNFHILLLAAYVASLLFSNIKISAETSLPFVLGAAWGISKLWSMLFRGQPFKLEMEGILLVVLYLYLVEVDALMHGGAVVTPYYISFALNGIMFLLLVDEFSKNVLLREKMMQVFFTTGVLVSVLLLIGVFTTQSQSDRLTFMGQNENELAVNFLIAFIFVTVNFARSTPKKTLSLVLAYASTMLLLNALIDTGTRFALYAAIMTLLLLIATVFRTPDMRRVTLFAFTCLVFLVAKVVSFAPTLQRLSPEVRGNNLGDLGGRVPLWREAIDALMQSPVNGLGYEGFQRFVLEHDKYFGMPHNFALEVGVLGGCIGLILLIALYFCMLRRVYNYWVQFKSFTALIWCMPILVTSMMLNITPMKAFWFLAAYFVAMASSAQKSRTADPYVI